jgi:Domain of unknown function (DUF4349)
MEPNRDDRLIADLQALRPTPRPQFAAELDERAAAGFPRRSRLPRLSFERLRAIPPRRLLIPAGAAVLFAIALATTLIVSQGARHGSSPEVAALLPEEQHGSTAPAPPDEGAAGVMYGSEVSAVPMGAAESEAAGSGTTYGSAGSSFDSTFQPSHRAVERSAEIVLAAEPDDVADDAAKVFEAVHAHDGIVMRSSTQQGAAGEAGAKFELLIPSTKLGDAMAAFAEIDSVSSRHEATDDITAPTVSAAELLQESRARIDSLLGQLEAAESDEEREAVEAELRHERRHASRLAAQLTHLHKRADLARVSLRIETGGKESSDGGGAWGIDDALHDAGHVLTVAAAVTLIALAVLGPIALIALLAWLSHRAWVRRERRRVLS